MRTRRQRLKKWSSRSIARAGPMMWRQLSMLLTLGPCGVARCHRRSPPAERPPKPAMAHDRLVGATHAARLAVPQATVLKFQCAAVRDFFSAHRRSTRAHRLIGWASCSMRVRLVLSSAIFSPVTNVGSCSLGNRVAWCLSVSFIVRARPRRSWRSGSNIESIHRGEQRCDSCSMDFAPPPSL